MKRVAVAVVVLGVLALGASEAGARTTITCDPACSRPFQQWVDDARVPSPDVTLSVVESTGGCYVPALACTDLETVWVAAHAPRSTFLHELGHVFARYYPEIGAITEAERFADLYMQCARLKRIDRKWSYSVGSGLIRGSNLRRVCWLIRSTRH